jgi:putative salt-induced outer membrane protein YdiY
VAALCAPRRASAQVNTETLRKRIRAVGYSLILEGSLTGDTGNTEGIAVGAGAGGGWARDPHLLFAYARFDYTKYNGATSVDKSFAHARYNYELERWLWGELFAQAQSDAFQRLDLRTLFGVGPRFRVLPDVAPKSFDVFVGTAYMFERDAITAVPGATGPQNQRIQIWHRWSNYLTLQWEIDPRAIIATTMYVQPAFNDFGDVRLLSETLLTFKVTKMFAAGIAASVRYDSEPPTAVLPTDTEIKNTLTLTL